MISPNRIHLDLASLLASTAGEIFSALDLANRHQTHQEEGNRVGIQVTEVLLDLPAVLEYVPGKRAAGGPRVLGHLRVRPPSTYPARSVRRPGRLRLTWTAREEPAHEQ
jgi:hypothetical protein